MINTSYPMITRKRTMPKTGSYVTKDDLGRKKRILRGVNVNIFQHLPLPTPTQVHLSFSIS